MSTPKIGYALGLDLTKLTTEELIQSKSLWETVAQTKIQGLTWILPTRMRPLLEPHFPVLLGRLMNQTDHLVPEGFSSLPQAYLFGCERKKDNLWAYQHPALGWSAISKTPQGPLYWKTPSWVLGRSPQSPFPGFWLHEGAAQLWAVLPLNRENCRVTKMVKFHPEAKRALGAFPLWADGKEFTQEPLGQWLLERFQEIPHLKLVSLISTLNEGVPKRIGDFCPEILTPFSKAQGLAVANARRQTDQDSLTGHFFYHGDQRSLTQERPPSDDRFGLCGIASRTLVSNMQGSNELKTGDWTLDFKMGQLESIHNGTEKNWAFGLMSYLQTDKELIPAHVISAFSLEGDYSWGLRQSSRFLSKRTVVEGRSVLDFVFTEDSPDLLLSMTIRYPQFLKTQFLKKWAPCEIVLWETGSSSVSVVAYDGEEKHILLLDKNSPEIHLSGSDFVFSCQKENFTSEAFLSFPQNDVVSPQILGARIERIRGKYRLVVSPEGSGQENALEGIQGWEEHFNVILGEPRNRTFPYRVTELQAKELLPPQILPPVEAPYSPE